MDTLLANLVSRPRRETLHGRNYLVSSATLIVPGVLNGSDGPLYYPESTVSSDPSEWNGMPIVVYHPQEHGKAVSARSPKVLAESGIGNVWESVYDGKHVAEAWFDEVLTKNYDKKL